MVFFLFYLLPVLCCLLTVMEKEDNFSAASSSINDHGMKYFDASNVAKSKEEEEMNSSLMQAGSSSRRPWTGCWLLKVRACAEYIGLTVMGVLLFIAEEPCGGWTRRAACRAARASGAPRVEGRARRLNKEEEDRKAAMGEDTTVEEAAEGDLDPSARISLESLEDGFVAANVSDVQEAGACAAVHEEHSYDLLCLIPPRVLPGALRRAARRRRLTRSQGEGSQVGRRQQQQGQLLLPSYEAKFATYLTNSKIIAMDLPLPEANSIRPSSEYIK